MGSVLKLHLRCSSAVFSTHQKARPSVNIQLYFLHISKQNIAYTFINCIFYASHTITYWGTLYAGIFNQMLHTQECHHISHTQHASSIVHPPTFILEVNYDASDEGWNTSNIRVISRENILLNMKYIALLSSNYFYFKYLFTWQTFNGV